MTEPSTLNVVIGMIRDSLNASGRDDESISSDTLLFYQLAFTSMDLLDLLFRIEQHFAAEDGRRDRIARHRGIPDTDHVRLIRGGVAPDVRSGHPLRPVNAMP